MFATDQISGGEYAGRLGITAVSRVANVATGGFGGGAAVTATRLAARGGAIGSGVLKGAVAADRANTAIEATQAGISTADAIKEGDYTRAAISAASEGIAATDARVTTEALTDGMRAKAWSPTHNQNQNMLSETEQSHHIIQDKAVADSIPGYGTTTAPTTKLESGSRTGGARIGTPHYYANQLQNSTSAEMRGTYGQERILGYQALRVAGQTRGTARANVNRADTYFKDNLNVTKSTATDNPNPRRDTSEN